MLKTFKRFCFVICALALITAFVPQVQADEDDRYGYSLLKNENQKEAYEEIAEGIEDCDPEITFTCNGITSDDVSMAVRMVTEDYPEYFCFDGNASMEIWSDGKVIVKPVEYSVDGKKVNQDSAERYLKELDDAAKKALKDLPKGNDREKVHYLHDYVASHVEYVSDGGKDDQTAYGALVEGRAVCAGYSRALQYLLQKAGIKAWYVTGYGLNPTTGETEHHGWNLIFLDGKCYYTDVTWDDQIDETYHAYFLLSLEEMSQTHVTDHPEYLPSKCNHKDMDYFVVHSGKGAGVGTLKNGYTAADIADCMKEVAKDTWECHMEDLTGGDAQSFYSWLQANVSEIAKRIGMQGGFSYSFGYLWDEYQITLVGSTEHVHTKPLLKVNAVESTCTQGGHTAYYMCNSCKQWFSDPNASNPITDQNSINTSPKGHNYSVWKNAGNEHWKACADCGSEEAGTRASHTDTNKDNKCDSCGVKVQSSSQGGSQGGSTTKPENPTTKPTEGNSQNPTTQPSIGATEETTQTPTNAPVTEATEETTTTSTQEPIQSESTGSTEGSVPATQESLTPESTGAGKPSTEGEQNEQPPKEETPVIPIVIGCAIAVSLGGAITLIVLRIRKKH
ncbi:MAG: hypothetical protein J6K03_01850 [Oscillospiraceae bacterium]|nr:hypothetical protein [Oscillospiraceae bacterium]